MALDVQAQDCLGVCHCGIHVGRVLDATGLAAAAYLDLCLHHHGLTDFFGNLACAGDCVCNTSSRSRHSVLGEEFLRLVFEEIHLLTVSSALSPARGVGAGLFWTLTSCRVRFAPALMLCGPSHAQLPDEVRLTDSARWPHRICQASVSLILALENAATRSNTMPVAAVIAPTPTVASDMRDDVSGHSPTYTRAATADPISNAAPRDGARTLRSQRRSRR